MKNPLKAIFPDAPPDVTKSPAYGAENSFASGLGAQRSQFTNTPTPTVSEATAPTGPASTGNADLDQGMKGWAGRDFRAAEAKKDAQKVYADPNGMNNQNFALGLDKAAAEGAAPSAAEQLYRKGTDEGMAAQLGLAATTQGDNPGMSQRAGLAGAAGVSNANAAGAGALRASEMATARDQYGNLATQTRGQTLDEAKANQEANIQQQLANNQFYLGLTDEQQKALVAMLGGAQANAKNQQDYNASNQLFYGSLGSSAGKAAGGA